MNNFEKDFEELININKKINVVNKEVENLNLQLNEKSEDFLKKYSIQKQMRLLGTIKGLLRNEVSAEKLIDLINRVEKGEMGLFSLVNKIKDHISVKKYHNDLLSYNFKAVRELHDKFNFLDSIENSESINNLEIGDTSIYLIDSNLELFLKNAYKVKLKKDKYNYVYMVVLNTIKKGDKSIIIYNYISYPKILLKLLYTYVSLEQKLYLTSDIKGSVGSDYFFIVDKQIRDRDPYISLLDQIIKKNTLYLSTDEISSYNNWFNIIQAAKWSVSGDIKLMNFEDKEDMKLIKFILMKDEVNMIKSLNKDLNIEKLKQNISTFREEKIYNYLSRFIFIVSDLDNFKNSLQNTTGMEVNQGPQKYRGQGSYISYILSRIDKDFRDSMCNHNRAYLNNYLESEARYEKYIPKSCFSFKNIHMNLGNVRFYSSTTNKKKNSNLILFNELKQILTDNPLNDDTQRKIEKFLIDSNVTKMNYDGSEFYDVISKLNKDLKNEFIRADTDLRSLINNFIERRIWEIYESKEKKLSQKELSLFYLSVILKDVPVDYIISIMLGKVLMIMNNQSQENNNTAVVFIELGKYLIDHYFYLLFKKEKINKLHKSSYSDKLMYNIRDWKIENNYLIEKFDNVVTHGIGGLLIDWLRDVNLLEINIDKSLKENHTVISVLKTTSKIENLFKSGTTNKPLMLPNRIPMIVKPKEYWRNLGLEKSSEQLGGYLLNGEYYSNEIIIKNWRSKINSSIEDVNYIYRTINNISSVGYKINREVLEFIRLNDSLLGLTLLNKTHPLEEKMLSETKLSKWEKVELDSFMSKKFVEENVLGLADLLENIPEFYIPVRLDYRGRMYCESYYLNYQSTDLAKSLLIFSKPSKVLKSDLKSIDYLKIYGANCFGNKLDKKSFEDRLKWVDDNIKDIIDFKNGILISKAESKFLFIAFCIEYKRWLNCIEDCETTHFNTYLPIQLDASCNGYQHISMLAQDIDLAKHLNLTKSNRSDVPNDFYTLISGYLTEYFTNILKKLDLSKQNKDIKKELEKMGISEDDKDSFERLISLDIHRSIIKRAIMTIPYNASSIQLIKYLQEPFEYDDEKTKLSVDLNYDLDEVKFLTEDVVEDSNTKLLDSKKTKKFIWYKNRKNPDIKLEERDFLNMYKGLMHILHNIFPSLSSLSKYFKDITKICTRLGISIPWYLPTGLIANQSYLEIKETKVKPLNFSNIEFRLNVLVKDKLDKSKQSRAFMPNLIHSLDATSLVLLIDKYFYGFNTDTKNIYAIHDCFAVTINHMDYIMNTLKMVYISLYSNEGYLSKLDNDLIKYIKNHLGDDFCIDKLTIELPSNNSKSKPLKIKYPNIKNVLKHTYNIQLVKGSSYIIH